MINDNLDLLNFLNLIKAVESLNKSLKKKKIIKKTAKSFFKYMKNKKSISAEDLSTLATIIKTSKVLNIEDITWAEDDDETYVEIKTFNSLNGFIGVMIHISTKTDDGSLYYDIKTNFNNKNNKVSLDLTWTINKQIDRFKTDTKIYHLSEVDCLYKHYKKDPNVSTDVLLHQSYSILYNAFIIYFEKLFNEIEMRYCDEQK